MAKEIKKHILSVYDENGNKIPIPAIGSKDYKLPAASENKLGGIKAPAKTPDQTVPVGIGEDNKLYVAPSGEEQVQSDWAENDPNNPAYVKNRFGGYEDVSEEVIFPEQDVAFDADGYAEVANISFVEGDEVTVNWGGEVTKCVAKGYYPFPGQPAAFYYVGNISFFGEPDDTGENFLIADYASEGYAEMDSAAGEGTVNISVSKVVKTLVKIPEKYLPDPLPPVNPDDESAFLQVTGGEARWSKLVVRSEKAPDEWTKEEWTKYGAVYDAGGSVECVSITGGLSKILYLDAVYKSALIVSENVSNYYADGRFRDSFTFSENEVQNISILTIEDGSRERGAIRRVKIKSSTPGSAKEFYIAVDDTGAIKTTDVYTGNEVSVLLDTPETIDRIAEAVIAKLPSAKGVKF